eukprot:517101-Alexandrium_andersonii.AAC.1
MDGGRHERARWTAGVLQPVRPPGSCNGGGACPGAGLLPDKPPTGERRGNRIALDLGIARQGAEPCLRGPVAGHGH